MMPGLPYEAASAAPATRPALEFLRKQGWLLLGAAAILVVMVLASVTWPGGLRVTGDVVARRITMTVEQDIDATLALPLDPPRADVSGAAWIEQPDGSRPPAREARITGAGLSLAALHLVRGATLTLASGRGGIVVQVGGGGSVDFEATAPVTLALDGEPARTVAASGAAMVAAGLAGGAAPLSVRSTLGKSSDQPVFTLDPVAVSALRFGEANGSGGFVSTILRGELRLLDVDERETLDTASPLALEAFAGAVVRLQGESDGLHVWFTGRARRVALGPPGFAEDLTPSVLALLYHQQSLKLLWAGAAVVVAALLKVRSWLQDLRAR